jgi:DNA-binding NtrC family response regulator
MRPKTTKLLIADDSRSVLTFIADVASRWSSSVQTITAENGRECMDALERDDIDLAFIDVNMPDMSGMEALGAARYHGIKTFVTLMSSLGTQARFNLARQLKVYEYLVKPFDAGDVEAILQTYRRISLPTRALVVDDSATVRRMIQKILSASLFRIAWDEAGDGESALMKCYATGYDIVFLDFNMPGLNGLDTLDQLLARNPSAKVIMMSAERDEDRVDLALQRGALEFLYKPFYAAEVDRALHKAYDLKLPSLAIGGAEEPLVDANSAA